MDILARKSFWEDGQNYKYRTGHATDSFLNAVESPIGMHKNSYIEFIPGHCITNEPTFYDPNGLFGIKIKNVLLCKKHPSLHNFLCWENKTFAPYSRELIDKAMLDPE